MHKGQPQRAFTADKLITHRSHGSQPRCDFAGCSNITREGKPFCSSHVEHGDYAKKVIADLEAQENEIGRVEKKGWKAVNVAAPIAVEFIGHLFMHGEQTVERLRREIMSGHLTIPVVEAYVKALHKARIVKLGRTGRGSETVKLVKQ